MNPPVPHPPGRGILAAIGFFAALATLLAPPFTTNLAAQAVALEFVSQPTNTEAGQTIPSFTINAVNSLGVLDPLFTGEITVSVASGPGGLMGDTDRDAFLGSVTFDDLSLEVAGDYTLQASASGLTPATSEPFQISPGPASGSTSEITASPTSIPADGSSSSTITVQLRDEFGNNIAVGGDDVALAKSGGGTLTATPVDNGDGTYTGTLTSDTSPETVTVTGTVNGGAIADDASVVFTAVPATRLEFGQQPTTETAGATITPAVTVRAENAAGNLDPNFNDPVLLTIATGPTGGTLAGTTTRTAMAGVATFDDLSIQQAGRYTLRASSGTLTGDTSAIFEITPGPPSGGTSEITASPTSIPADGSSISTITVVLRDTFGNDLTTGGAIVTVSTTLGTLGPVTDNGDGSYSAPLTSTTTSGTARITGTFNGAPITDDATVAFAVGSADLEVEIEVDDDSPVVGGQVVYELTVRNQGPDNATGIELTHALPPRLELVSATATLGAYAPSSGVWSVGRLDAGAEATLTITVRVLGPESEP